MISLLRWWVWLLGRVVVGLRYRAQVFGRDQVSRHPGPYLVLPNHPAFADPPNVLVHLWPIFRFRPMLLETNFQNPILAPFAWLLRAIRVPDLEKSSADAKARAELAVADAVSALKAGDNVVLWPSGRLMRDGLERLGGARAVAEILAQVPECTVILVRTRGLWGSMLSWAQALRPTDGPPRMPGLGSLMLKSLGVLLSNALIFAPRRPVKLTLEAFSALERPAPSRELINRWLQEWYNADLGGQPEPPTWVQYHFLLGSRSHSFPAPETLAELDPGEVQPATQQLVREVVQEKLKRPLTDSEYQPATTYLDLGIDSLDGMDIALQIEQRTGFSSDTVPQSIGQLWALAEGRLQKAGPKPAPVGWDQPLTTEPKIHVLAETIAEAFVRQALAHPQDVAVADDLAGAVTYERLLVGARIMAKRFRPFPEPNIGLLIPASVGGDLALLGLHLAGKLPVILNWTTGPGNLDHAVRLTELKRVVTSRAFLDRTHVVVPGVEYVFLEELRQSIRFVEKLTTLFSQRWFSSRVLNRILQTAQTDPQQPAVVLFTSGSEKAPKAVPLTHANVLANMRGCLAVLGIDRRDSVLGFLPLFHSFGHTVTTLFPLLGGVKVVHHPDPTDALGLARKIATYRPTLLATTPTFYRYILDRAEPGQLDSLRMVVIGAEKCPESLFTRSKEMAPHAEILEGYGITECSPVVSVNPPHAARIGSIGKPLPGVTVRIRDLETLDPVPPGERGMLTLSGASIFPGYLGENASPFEETDGRRWYVTGDLVSQDADGYLTFHGRLKRFIKSGGEMISLPALEEPLVQKFPATERGPRIAVEGWEFPEGRRIVLFTTEALSLSEANKILQEAGLRGIMRIDEVERLDTIPILGTGKTDYKLLKQKIIEKMSHGS